VSGSPFDQHDMHKHVAEGRADQVLDRRSKYGIHDSPVPTFLRFVVLDVISDPQIIDSVKLSHWEHDLGVCNTKYASIAPPNSIIARRAMGQDSTASEKVMVLYPFFPPHLGFPAKPGEHVWVMFEHPDAKVNELGYWFCRIVQPSFVEDVNYTHADRQFDASFLPGLSDLFNGTADPKYEFHNGAVDTDSESGERFVAGTTNSLPGDDKSYTDLLTNSDAAKIEQFESIPRFRKRPSDIAFEGSNNTLFVMGTDRTGPLTNYTTDQTLGQVPQLVQEDMLPPGAGMIDFVVGRGQTDSTGGTPVTNSLGNKEIGKSKGDTVPKEGDPDLINDRSRILISQKTKSDTNFNITNVVSAHTSTSPVTDGSGGGAIVIKTDKVRIIARQDVVIMVSGPAGTDSNGNAKDPSANIDPSQCASITLRTNGDIIFTPSSSGIVKLGGDDADKALLAADISLVATNNNGTVSATPIMSTMGGFVGAGGAQGVYCTKVMAR